MPLFIHHGHSSIHIRFISPFVSIAVSRDMAGDSRAYRSAEESARDLTTSIRREGGKLAERWAALRDRTERWGAELDTTTNVRRPFCPLFLLFSHASSGSPGRRSSHQKWGRDHKLRKVKSLRIRIPTASLRIGVSGGAFATRNGCI